MIKHNSLPKEYTDKKEWKFHQSLYGQVLGFQRSEEGVEARSRGFRASISQEEAMGIVFLITSFPVILRGARGERKK